MYDTHGISETDRTEAIWATVAAERRRMADELERLTDEQWSTPSQCEAWNVEALAAHLITPFETSTPRFLFTMAKKRGDFDRAIIELTSRVAARHSRREVIAKLREHAENRWTPPGAGPATLCAEIVVHSQDIRRPLGIDCPIPAETIDLALGAIDDPELRADYAGRIGVTDPAGE